MCEDCDCDIDFTTSNPLIMVSGDFIVWLHSRGIDLDGAAPADPVQRASLLFHAEESGYVRKEEIKGYLEDIGLMVPVEET